MATHSSTKLTQGPRFAQLYDPSLWLTISISQCCWVQIHLVGQRPPGIRLVSGHGGSQKAGGIVDSHEGLGTCPKRRCHNRADLRSILRETQVSKWMTKTCKDRIIGILYSCVAIRGSRQQSDFIGEMSHLIITQVLGTPSPPPTPNKS